MRQRYRRPSRVPLPMRVEVAGESMTPAFQPGDWLLAVRGVRPRVGSAVVLRDPREPERLMVKRVRERRATGWWVEGDNPARSTDSRRFGPVPDDLVVAVVLVRYMPLIRVRGPG